MNTDPVQRLRELHTMALETQRQHMLIVRDSHEFWLIETDDIETNRMRREIIDLIGKTIDRYDELLEILYRKGNGGRKNTTAEEKGFDQT